MTITTYDAELDVDEEDRTLDGRTGEDRVPSPSRQFSTRQLPWLKIGTVIDDDVDAAEAARLGGIDFDVELRDAGYRAVDGGDWVEQPTRRAVVREDTGEWFSYVSVDYKPVQYREAFEFMDGVNPRYVAAGALNGGRQGFMVVQLPEHAEVDVTIDGVHDPHDMYVVLRTSHDLSKAIEVAVMMLRGKCMNQLTLPSLTAGARQRWGVRHVGDPHARLEQAKTTLTGAANYKAVFERTATQLGSVKLDAPGLRRVLERVLPDRVRRVEQVDAITAAFETAETVGFTGTGWGAVNAVSEYFQWGRSLATRTYQSQFTSPLDGDTAKYVNRTAQLLLARA